VGSAQPAHAADRFAREILAILAVCAARSQRLMGNPLGGISASIQVQEKTNDSGTHLRTAIVSRVSD
jgi:hypothetical protein